MATKKRVTKASAASSKASPAPVPATAASAPVLALSEVGREVFSALVNFSKADLQATLGGDTMSQFDFDRIKIPAGGSTVWELPSIEGTDAAKDFAGVVIEQKILRVYWPDRGDKNAEPVPPSCASDEGGYRGFGDPGGICAECPNAQWGSDPRGGRGKACKEVRVLYIIREGNILPDVMILPPTSIKPWRQFCQRLLKRQVGLQKVLVGFTLDTDKNADGQKYSKVNPQVLGQLSAEDKVRVAAYREAMLPVLKAPDIRSTEASGDEE
jgi:hypothetical protein